MEYLYKCHSICAGKVQMIINSCMINDQNYGPSIILKKSQHFHLYITDNLNVLETIFLRINLLVNRGFIVS